MKNLLFRFILLFPILTFSQTKGDITIDWIINNSTNQNTKSQTPLFKGDAYFYDSYHQSLYYNLNLKNTSDLDEKSIQISNVIYETMTTSDLGNLNISAIPSNIKLTLYSIKSRNIIQNFLRISPIIREVSGYKRIKSFSYTINSGSSKKIISNKTCHKYLCKENLPIAPRFYLFCLDLIMAYFFQIKIFSVSV